MWFAREIEYQQHVYVQMENLKTTSQKIVLHAVFNVILVQLRVRHVLLARGIEFRVLPHYVIGKS